MSAYPEKIAAIVGGTCSGKTELGSNLQGHYGERVSLFPFDDMFVGVSALDGHYVSDWESPDLYRWEVFNDALQKLKNGQTVTIEANSRESTEAGITHRTLEPSPIVVVAGFLALHNPEVNLLYDDTIFIDITEEEIIRRRKARAVPGSPWDTDEYINNGLLPGHRKYVVPQKALANHIVDGMADRESLAAEVIRLIGK